MLSDTLVEGLETYRIGAKIRALRTAKKMGLAQLGDHTGMSAGMLSKIERGQVFPTLPTLLRVALVFGVGLDHFFAPGEERPMLEITRQGERLAMPDTPEGDPAYLFQSLDYKAQNRRLQGYLADFPAKGAASQPHSHDGEELIHVLQGALEVRIHDRVHRLDAGDSMHFDAGFDHSYCAAGGEGCSVIVAVHESGRPENGAVTAA